jgi:tagaturonate reductase
LITNAPPTSFPAKLLAWLFERYKIFGGSKESGVVIVPTELIIDNATKLKLILLKLAELNKLDKTFIEWLEQANDFCNSLVDRIVPGKMPEDQHKSTEAKLGHTDDLMIMSEVYSLWAIETSNQRSKDILSFAKVDSGVVIAPDINKFRELKLRLLNGTHTFSCGLAFLAGFDTVKDAMADNSMSLYVHDLMTHEIAPCIESVEITRLEAYQFAKSVIDRFRNPHIDHRWLSITMNFTGKMQMRNLPLITKHYQDHDYAPQYMAAGFAAYLLFMKAVEEKDGKYYGERKGELYHINDSQAVYFYQLWQGNGAADVVKKALAKVDLWGTDLNTLDGFADAVTNYLQLFLQGKYVQVLEELKHSKKEIGI